MERQVLEGGLKDWLKARYPNLDDAQLERLLTYCAALALPNPANEQVFMKVVQRGLIELLGVDEAIKLCEDIVTHLSQQRGNA